MFNSLDSLVIMSVKLLHFNVVVVVVVVVLTIVFSCIGMIYNHRI